MFLWALVMGCGGDTAALEQRVEALETQLVTMELRVDDLEVFVYSEEFGAQSVQSVQSVQPVPAEPVNSEPPADPTEVPETDLLAELVTTRESVKAAGEVQGTEKDPVTGEIFSTLDEAGAVLCALKSIDGVVTAQRGYDAAFDSFGDLSVIGWDFDNKLGCRRYLALRVELLGDGQPIDFDVVAVITRGEGRGRRFVTGEDHRVFEKERMNEVRLIAFLAEPGWVGSAE